MTTEVSYYSWFGGSSVVALKNGCPVSQYRNILFIYRTMPYLFRISAKWGYFRSIFEFWAISACNSCEWNIWQYIAFLCKRKYFKELLNNFIYTFPYHEIVCHVQKFKHNYSLLSLYAVLWRKLSVPLQ